MTALTVIHLNGPINSGKTTIGLALARVLPDARFIDGDDHDAPDDAPLDVQWALALERLVAQIAAARERHLVIAYPIDEAEHTRLRAACDARDARLFVVTLAPPEAIAASNRGTRADGLGAQPDRRDVSRRLCVAAVQPDGAGHGRYDARCMCGAHRAARRYRGVVTPTPARTPRYRNPNNARRGSTSRGVAISV